jgi:organic hydroperoxide reductase OsmC/OhrA
MKPFPHRYDIHLRSDSGSYASAQVLGAPDLRCAPPIEFGGPGDAWSPEHLLLAAVEACYLFTLRAIARASRIDILDGEIETSGTVDRQDGVTRFVEIVLSPSITVAAGSDDGRIPWLLEKAKRSCLVSASLATPIRLNPVVTYARHASPEPAAAAG